MYGVNYHIMFSFFRFSIKSGEICLDILKKEWSPIWTLESAVRAVITLLAYPEAGSPLNCDAGNLIRSGDMIGFNSLARMYSMDEAQQQFLLFNKSHVQVYNTSRKQNLTKLIIRSLCYYYFVCYRFKKQLNKSFTYSSFFSTFFPYFFTQFENHAKCMREDKTKVIIPGIG